MNHMAFFASPRAKVWRDSFGMVQELAVGSSKLFGEHGKANLERVGQSLV